MFTMYLWLCVSITWSRLLHETWHLFSFLFPNRLNLIYLTLILHGIGTLMPWNMFITAKEVRSLKVLDKQEYIYQEKFSSKQRHTYYTTGWNTFWNLIVLLILLRFFKISIERKWIRKKLLKILPKFICF